MSYRRSKRNYFPEPKFQLRFLGLLIGGLTIQTVVTWALVTYFVRENYTLLVKFGALDQELTQILYRELAILVAGISASFLLFLVGACGLGVIFSHRIAGPIYALKRTIRNILDGKDVELNFRNRDEFRELVDSFNEMVRRLRRGELGAERKTG